MKTLRSLVIALVALCWGTIHAEADVIPGLINTGFDAADLRAADDAADAHYTIVGGPLVTPVAPEVVDPEFFGCVTNAGVVGGPVGWAWVSPNIDLAGSGPPGPYVYELEFDLTGLDPDTAFISGTWAALELGTSIFLNGVATAFPTTCDALTFFGFSAAAGDVFLPGINTLHFETANLGVGDSTTGIQVQVSGTADPKAVPEPSTLLLLTIGLASIVHRCRRVKKASRR